MRRHFQATVENRPDHRMAHFELGRLLVHKGQFAEAINHFQQTLKPEDENTPRYLYALAAAPVIAPGDCLICAPPATKPLSAGKKNCSLQSNAI